MFEAYPGRYPCTPASYSKYPVRIAAAGKEWERQSQQVPLPSSGRDERGKSWQALLEAARLGKLFLSPHSKAQAPTLSVDSARRILLLPSPHLCDVH